jgi:hypothetical protein
MNAKELAELRRDALQAVRDVLGAPDAKPADRLRAAEVVAKLEVTAAARGGVHELSDQELLAIARGTGGTPRKGDPETPSAGAVPSDTDDQRSPDSGRAMSDSGRATSASATSVGRTAEAPVVPRETPPKGAQNGPAPREDPPAEINPLLAIRKKGPDGTQKGPAISGGPSAQFAPPPQIGHSPEPWE